MKTQNQTKAKIKTKKTTTKTKTRGKQAYRRLLRDERGISPYVAVIVLIALALLIYTGAKTFGDKVNEKFEQHGNDGVGAIQSAPGAM